MNKVKRGVLWTPTEPDTFQNVYVEVSGPDEVILFQFWASQDTTITIHGGDTVMGGGDMSISMTEGEEYWIFLESGPYLTHNEAGKPCIHISCDTYDIEYRAVQLI
ncbi:MAG: hypothetical protein IKM48_06960 [Clostridia bacterium]|nr:hypothetical protein [Clostridia bacterium]